MKLKKTFSKIHLYVSIPVGLIISIICLSGASMVLDKDIHKWSNPDMYFVESTQNTAIPIDSLVEIISQKLPEGTKTKAISTFSDPNMPYQFSVKGTLNSTVFVNQYTGEYLGEYNQFQKGGLYRTMFHLHRWLMISSQRGEFNIGKFAVGVSTIIFVIALITGLVMWWPSKKSKLKKAFSIRVTKGWYRFLYDLHIKGGLYATIWLLVLALTGLLWSFPRSYRPAVYTLFGVDTRMVDIEIPASANRKAKVDYSVWQNAHSQVVANNPSAYSYSISPAEVRVYPSQYGNTSAYESNYFDISTGIIKKIVPYSQCSGKTQIMGLMYSIHIGTWGGLTTKILTFIISLIGGLLPLTGYYLWIKRTVKRKRKR